MTPGQICNQDDITFTNDPTFLHNIRLREELKKRYTNCIFMLGIGLFFGSIATFLSIWLTYTAVMYQIRSEHPDAHWQIVHK